MIAWRGSSAGSASSKPRCGRHAITASGCPVLDDLQPAVGADVERRRPLRARERVRVPGGVEHDAPRFADRCAGAGVLSATSPIVTEFLAVHWPRQGPLLLQCPHEQTTQAPLRRLVRRSRDADDGVRVAARAAAAGRAGPAAARARCGAGRTRRRAWRAPEGRGAAPAAPAPKPLVPVATNTIAANPDAFYGQAVTITASMEADPLEVVVRRRSAPRRRRAGAARARPTSSCWCRTSSARSISRATSR